MTFSIRLTIQELVVPKHGLCCSSQLWRDGLLNLKRRGDGRRESGAFLLGTRDGERRIITDFAFYDDLDPRCLDTGIVVFDGTGYGPLWRLCRERGREVVADVHTHRGQARQSSADRAHPMLAKSGHIALIVPDFAQRPVRLFNLGIYEYQGDHCWQDHSGHCASKFFCIKRWR